jgi:hypothetical protein
VCYETWYDNLVERKCAVGPEPAIEKSGSWSVDPKLYNHYFDKALADEMLSLFFQGKHVVE